MALLTRWPFLDERRLYDDVLRSVAPFLTTPSTATAPERTGVFPAVNIYDDGESFLVRAEIPGVDKQSLDISVKGNQLVLRGERRLEPATEAANYHRREREGGKFRRVVTMPEQVDAEKISANYKGGVLEVVLPRSPQARERRIEIH